VSYITVAGGYQQALSVEIVERIPEAMRDLAYFCFVLLLKIQSNSFFS
jgi:hypothetical protein